MTAAEIEIMAREAFDWEVDSRGRVTFTCDIYGAVRFSSLVKDTERERCACLVRDFPHWLGPQAKRELLAALYGPIATGGIGVDSEPTK